VVDKSGKVLAAEPGGPDATCEVVKKLIGGNADGGLTAGDQRSAGVYFFWPTCVAASITGPIDAPRGTRTKLLWFTTQSKEPLFIKFTVHGVDTCEMGCRVESSLCASHNNDTMYGSIYVHSTTTVSDWLLNNDSTDLPRGDI
jgi:hypothetical protein